MRTDWIKVLATHQEKQELSTGPWLGDSFPGVALPSVKALRRWIMLRCGDRWTCAQVMDVGPFCEDDDGYVWGDLRPRAEIFKGKHTPRKLNDPDSFATLPDGTPVEKSNGAGIDLFPYTAKQLGIALGENVDVEWKFVEIV